MGIVGDAALIPDRLQPILARLNIEPSEWTSTVSNFKRSFGNFVGSITVLDDWREKHNEEEDTNIKWLKGNKVARPFYRS